MGDFNLKVHHETRSHAHGSLDDEKVIMTRKQKAESKAEHSPTKKPKQEDGHTNGKSVADVAAEYDEFCKTLDELVAVDQMREILESNGVDSSAFSDLEVTRTWLVMNNLISLLN